jgi:hypothetical protein
VVRRVTTVVRPATSAGGDHYHVAWALQPPGYYGPNFGSPIRTAPGQSYFYEPPPFSLPLSASFFEWYYGSTPTSYTGPLVLLVGTDTVSAGENFSMLLSNNGRPMHNADGSQLIGIGIPVDIPVTLTQQNLANGNDPELNTAVELLGP